MKRAVVPAVALVTACTLALAGCSGGNSPDPEAGASATPVTVIGEGADIENQLDARSDVEVTKCKADDDEGRRWKVEATATNSTEEDVTYELALRYASAKDGSVLAREALKTEKVKPGKSTTIETASKLEKASEKVNCIFVSIARHPA